MTFSIKEITFILLTLIIGLYSCSEESMPDTSFIDTEHFISEISLQSGFDLAGATVHVGKSDQLTSKDLSGKIDPNWNGHFVVFNVNPSLYEEEFSETIEINKFIKEKDYHIDFVVIQNIKGLKELKDWVPKWIPQLLFLNSVCSFNPSTNEDYCLKWWHTQLVVSQCVSSRICASDSDLPTDTDPLGGN